MASERLTPLIDKEPVLKQGLWGHSVFSNIQLKKMTGFHFKLYETEPIAFAQDAERLLNGIKIIEVQGCDFTGPGTGIVARLSQFNSGRSEFHEYLWCNLLKVGF